MQPGPTLFLRGYIPYPVIPWLGVVPGLWIWIHFPAAAGALTTQRVDARVELFCRRSWCLQ